MVIASLTVRAGKHAAFEEFERHALAIMKRHGGELLHVVEPVGMLPPGNLPDAVHILRFASQQSLEDYRTDPALVALAPLRAEAISATHLLIGNTLA